MNDHVHPTVANVLNAALGQPVNHAGGKRLAEAVASVPPLMLGNRGYHTDAAGKAFPLNAEQRANLERVRSDVVAMADDFSAADRREMIEALGGEYRPKCQCGAYLETVSEQRDGVCVLCDRRENAAWSKAQKDHPNNGG